MVSAQLVPWRRMQAVFDRRDCSTPVLPPRSRLYALEPIGIGTPFVESLSGYVARLANAHAVSVGDLVGRELSSLASKPLISLGPSKRQNRANSHGFHGMHTIQSFAETSKRWINVLETATLQKGLQFLTLLLFDGVFSTQGVSRERRAWCPGCYEEWRTNGAVIYEPLLWSINLVVLCTRHRIPLSAKCPQCLRSSKPLAAYSRPGHCSHCQEWLGGSPEASPESEPDAARANDTKLWYAKAISELLEIAPRLEGCSLHNVITSNLRACVEVMAGGNADSFARTLQVSQSSLNFYLYGNRLPGIDIMLRISYRLGVPITAFLEKDPSRAEPYWRQARHQGVERDPHIPAVRSPEQVRRALVTAAEEQPAPSLPEIAKRLGYKGTARLYRVDRDLSKQIARKY